MKGCAPELGENGISKMAYFYRGKGGSKRGRSVAGKKSETFFMPRTQILCPHHFCAPGETGKHLCPQHCVLACPHLALAPEGISPATRVFLPHENTTFSNCKSTRIEGPHENVTSLNIVN